MDATRFDAVLRSLVAGRSRRGLLAGLSGGVLVALPGVLGRQETAARKKKKKKRNPPTCAEVCPASATFCVHRAANPPFCADGYGNSCLPCTSDQDCLGVSGRPYCVTAYTDRNGNSTANLTGPGSECPSLTTAGVCATVWPP